MYKERIIPHNTATFLFSDTSMWCIALLDKRLANPLKSAQGAAGIKKKTQWLLVVLKRLLFMPQLSFLVATMNKSIASHNNTQHDMI